VFGSISRREAANRQDIAQIRLLIWENGLEDIAPPSKVVDLFRPDIVGSEFLLGFCDRHGRCAPNVLQGIDRFGTPYIYEMRCFDTADQSLRYEVMIRSAGANRRDDGGRVDDVTRIVDVNIKKNGR
jgi:hypothetical protein